MDDMPFITVAIPAYQRVQYIREAIQSALSQNYDSFEVLISDDSDHDEISAIASSFQSPRIRYIRNRPPLGLVPKLNTFLTLARGDWVVVLCDDDRFEPGFLRALAGKIITNPGATSFRCRYRLINEKGRLLRENRTEKEVMRPLELLSRIFLPPGDIFTINITGVLFSKSAMLNEGGFRDYYMGLNTDRLAWAALGLAGDTVSIPEALCSLRMHNLSGSGGTLGSFDRMLADTLQCRAECALLLSRAESMARTPEEKELVKLAREHAKGFIGRQLRSGLDKSLRGMLNNPSIGPAEVRGVLKRAKENGTPAIRSAGLYQILAHLPGPPRKIILNFLNRYMKQIRL